MTQETVQVTGGKPKRKPRKDVQKKIVVRVSDDEYRQLNDAAAGRTTVSELVRSRALRRGVRNQDVLLQIAALHTLGMRVKALGLSGAFGLTLQAMLLPIQAEITRLARQLPTGGDDGEVQP